MALDFKDTLKSQLNIVDVVEQYVRLKRSGTRWVGLCPFHSEKTPSFGVNADLQIFKCFGCQEGGDVFTFIQKIEGITFFEALKLLAERAGIPMPERARPHDPAGQRREAILDVEEKAASIFESNLHSRRGAGVRRYLAQRNVSMETARAFRLGLADSSGRQLLQRLKDYDPALLEEAGLVKHRDEGSYYDYFRDRLIFPIHSESGRLIAFAGRALRDEDNPKYLNSPKSAVYDKSAVLYNLHRAKGAARKSDRIIEVEGYMDVIGVAAAGISEVVAICGAALTPTHARLIKRHCRSVIINLDLGRRPNDPTANTGWEWTDRAGPAATEKSIPLLLAEGLRPHVLTLEGGQDPDEFIAEHGVERYAALCDSALRYYIWLATDRAKQLFDTTSAEGRVDAFQYVLRYVRHETNRVEREEISREVALALDLDPNAVFDQLRPRASAQPRQPDAFLGIPKTERLLLTCMLHSDQARTLAVSYLNQSVLVRQLSLAPAFEAFLVLERERIPYSFEGLTARVETAMQHILHQIAFADTQLDPETAAIQAAECIRALETKQGESDRGELRKQIRRLEQEGNFEEAMRLANELDKHVRASS
jgi:DNA primase